MKDDFTPRDDLSKNLQDERFLRLLRGNQNGIFSFILALVHNQNDADDIMQETTTVMWRKFNDFELGTNFAGWGISIARNKVNKFFEKHRKSRQNFKDSVIRAIEKQAESRINETNPRVEALKDCIGKLSRSARQLIQMRYDRRMSAQKTADLLNLSVHKFYRSMAKIHKSLEICIHRTLTEKRISQ